MISLLIYISPSAHRGKTLESMIRNAKDLDSAEFFNSINHFTERLRRPLTGGSITVLFPSDEKELSCLIGIRPFLMDSRVILVLSGRSKAAVSQAHRLRPRFLIDAGNDFSEILLVIGKMRVYEAMSPPPYPSVKKKMKEAS